ncbi:MAG: demethoxyubiquinone hydroxylase family protein, partial [Gammaproteobacteria bacterium]
LSIGIMAGLVSDKYSLGFVVETEKQVEIHLTEHLVQLPANDASSRAILLQMAIDEQQHGQNAQQQGAKELPECIKYSMRIPAKIMTTLAYYI